MALDRRDEFVIPPHLTIRILYSDDEIVVIDKPCDLRSVPGHANPPPPEKEGPRSNSDSEQTSHRRTAQEAWVKAIQLMSAEDGGTDINDIGQISSQGISLEVAAVREVIRNLGTTADPSCVPRKLETFVKYCHRNSRRLLLSFGNLRERVECEPRQKKQKIDTKMREIASLAHADIQRNQRHLMNLPKPTEDWESAIGQLRMLGFGDYSNVVSAVSKDCGNTEKRHPDCTRQSIEAKLHVVHRLDCQVSPINDVT
jgi:hypothetical protein